LIPLRLALQFSSVPTTESHDPTAPESTVDEERLVCDAVAGNTRAFEQIVRLHSSRIFNYLNQMTRQRQDAEDLTQQTFIKAYNHLARFDPRRPIINWLLTIARRTALNHFRGSKRWEEIPADMAGSGPAPDRQLEQRDRSENIWNQARARLSPREFEVLWLRFAEELSTEETARVVGLTQTHVKVLVFRARQALQKGAVQL
jgi:RNA polymerase sigma-70 factor, ECF subfamily